MPGKAKPASSNDSREIGLQPASLDIWDKKYRLKTKDGQPLDPDVDGTWQRVARALAGSETPEQREHWYERFLWALRHGAIPAGRIVSNAGALEHKPATSTINCTVSGTVEDSMDRILAMVHEAGLTLKAGCGIGYEFSTLRPRGAFVAGAGSSTSGPLSFMDIFDAMCRTISSAGGRRGAQMATFDITHPDIVSFVRAKREAGRLRQFNLSCLITEPFMEAVKGNLEWELVFPANRYELEDPTAEIVYRPWPVTTGYRTNAAGEVACRVYRRLPARRLWDVIMASTYDYAEPGFILIDRVREMNNNWFCETIRATNPCVTGDTWVHTSQGPRQVRDLLATPFAARLDGEDHPSAPAGFFATGVKPVVRLTTQEGYTLRLTPDHRLRRVTRVTRDGSASDWLPVSELQPGDRVLLNDHHRQTEWSGPRQEGEGYLLGLLLGDGFIHGDKAVLSVWKPALAANGGIPSFGPEGVMDAALRATRALVGGHEITGWDEVPGQGEWRLELPGLKELAGEMGLAPGAQEITPTMEATSSAFHRGLLRGLFDGNASPFSTKGTPMLRLTHGDEGMLRGAQRMLLRLGIPSQLLLNRRGLAMHVVGELGSRRLQTLHPWHELVLTGEAITRFAERIGFEESHKAARLRLLLAPQRRGRGFTRLRFTATVESLQEAGEEMVYDVAVPGVNAFDGNGFHAHNCGEQPLPPYGACLLGSVNLTHFVRQPFTRGAHFDWEQYREVVGVFTRMLDNVVEIHGLPLDGQGREILRKRRHGMGYLGLGSAITMLGMTYGDDASVAFTGQVSREMAATGWEVGIELAREKGPAPIMDELFTVDSAMLAQRPELAEDGVKVGEQLPGRVLLARYSRYLAQFPEALREAIAREGCRFTHHTSIAPTGTISLSLGNNASNGIEPSFAHKYSRNVIREGKKTKEKVDVFSYELLAYRALINAGADPYAEDDKDRLPPYFVDTNSIPPKAHVDIQAAAQKWIDSSISKTINVPQDYPYDAFKEVYLYAYEKGLKGCTTFRFNPEAFQGVLVKDEDLANTTYRFTLADGSMIEMKGNEEVEYDGEIHSAANLYDALKEGYYGKL